VTAALRPQHGTRDSWVTVTGVTDDERWAYFVAVPALVLSLPVYVVATAVYVSGREAFATSLEFIEHCGFISKPGAEAVEDAA
jgi:hypothetical protein